MPSLDSCISNIYEPGNIPGSPGQPPTPPVITSSSLVVMAGRGSLSVNALRTEPPRWAPTQLGADLLAWYPMDQISGSNNASIATLTDASGNGKHAVQSVGTQQGTLIVNGLAGRNIINFNSANSQFYNVPNIFSGKTSGAGFAVMKNNFALPVEGGALWDFGSFSFTSSPGVYNHHIASNGVLQDDFGADGIHSSGTAIPIGFSSTYRLLNVFSSASAWGWYVDAANPFNDGYLPFVGWNTAPTIGGQIGSVAAPAACFQGRVAEFIFVSPVPTTTNRQLIEGYLMWKWAMQAQIPGGHPWIGGPPPP